MKIEYIPKVCICIPAYNAEATIAKTLDSLINQTYQNIIIKVIDNNSQDNTVQIVKPYVEKYNWIHLFEYKITVPADENFDRCIEHAEGEYTCIFHSDDMYLPTIVEKELNFLMKHEAVGAVFTYANVINENDEKISQLWPNRNFLKKDIYDFNELFPVFLSIGNFFVTPSAMVRTEIYKNEIVKHKRDQTFGDAFDVDVWLRILKKHKVGFIYEKLMNYRLSIYSTSFRKLLLYKNTVVDYMFNVLEYNIKEEKLDKLLFKGDYVNLKTRNLLSNVFKAYVCGDFSYAKKLQNNIKVSLCNKKLKIIKFAFDLMILFKIPLFVRKIMIYLKYRNVFKGQFNKILLSK